MSQAGHILVLDREGRVRDAISAALRRHGWTAHPGSPSSRLPGRHRPYDRMTHFSPYRPTPFGGVWFAVEDGTLAIAAPDA